MEAFGSATLNCIVEGLPNARQGSAHQGYCLLTLVLKGTGSSHSCPLALITKARLLSTASIKPSSSWPLKLKENSTARDATPPSRATERSMWAYIWHQVVYGVQHGLDLADKANMDAAQLQRALDTGRLLLSTPQYKPISNRATGGRRREGGIFLRRIR